MRLVLFVVGALLLAHAQADRQSDGYKHAAEHLRKFMNPSVDPCNDFYEYACGNYKNIFDGTDDTEDFFLIRQVEIINKLGEALIYLDPFVAPKTPKFPYDQLGIAFATCLNGLPNEDPKQDMRLLHLFVNSLGGWPSGGKFNQAAVPGGPSALTGLLAGLANIQPVMTMQVTENINNPDYLGLLFGPQNIQVNKTGQLELPNYNDILLSYAYGVKFLAENGMTKEERDAIDWPTVYKDATKVAYLIIESLNTTWNAMGRKPPPNSNAGQLEYYAEQFHAFTIEEATQRWPHINWAQLLLNLAYGNTDLPSMMGQPFWVAMPKYVDWLDWVMANFDDRTLWNWQMYYYVLTQASRIPKMSEIYELYQHGEKTTRESPTRMGRCAYQIAGELPELLSRVYANQAGIIQADVDMITEMIGLVLASWRGMITTVPWITEASRQNAYAKIRGVVRNVAWPKWIFNDAALADHYKNLAVNVNDDSFTATNKVAFAINALQSKEYIQFQRWGAWRQFSQVGKPVNRYMWHMSAMIVNAYYAPEFNSINFPAAIMTPPFFNSSFPPAFNYAHLGWVLGHELGHGFDNNGIYWGPRGEYINTTWADNKTKEGFANMSKCVVDEYNQFCMTIQGTKYCVDGQRCLGENIADNGGLIAAHRAFTSVLTLQGGEPKMPAGYGPISTATDEQLFFIAAANTWCSNWPDEFLIQEFEHDVHSPDMFRVAGTLRNMPSMGKAFNCKPGDKYEPKTRCHVWTE